MISTTPRVPVDRLTRETGWEVKPQGACRGEQCVPLPEGTLQDGEVELAPFAQRLRRPPRDFVAQPCAVEPPRR